ncbi:hypothetical protein VAWG002_21850 [Aeromonas veronii]|nr:hypothetical protein VAWG002_21850 [Aeromonas veronii]
MRELGYQIGRFKVRNLMKEAGLVSKQPGAHRYKVAQSERPDIPNLLAREFDVQQPNQVWCGDITYVWAGGRWHYLAAVLDLHTRRVVGWAISDKPDAELAIKARWPISSGVAHSVCCFTPIRAANMAVGHFGNDCGAIA